jgi:hypothetical protein
MMRLCTLAVVAVTTLVGCGRNGGAVSVRWKIIDLASGDNFTPSARGANDGSCCLDVQNGECNPGNQTQWVIRTVSVVLSDPNTGAMAVDVGGFPCRQGEETTKFNLPPGTYAIALEAEVSTVSLRPLPSAVPPPQLHTIVRGEVVNLQEIEIGVNPLPVPAPPALPGPTDMVTF